MKRVALITGAAEGLGRAIAERLAADGAEVIIADVNLVGAEATAQAFRVSGMYASALALNVGDEGSIAAAYDEIRAHFGRLDILVNNAGIAGLEDGRRLPLEQTSLAAWERTMRVNLTGTLLMCRAAIALLRLSHNPRIVNITSRAARARPVARVGAYAASKAAVIGLSQVLAVELGSGRITVNCVAPSSVRSSMTMAASAGQDDYFERAAERTAVGRVGEPQDVADAVAYLCSPEAGFVTGTVIDVTGGSFMP
jgi:3-oxoacyl-[acyl-carrier protein] reductase